MWIIHTGHFIVPYVQNRKILKIVNIFWNLSCTEDHDCILYVFRICTCKRKLVHFSSLSLLSTALLNNLFESKKLCELSNRLCLLYSGLSIENMYTAFASHICLIYVLYVGGVWIWSLAPDYRGSNNSQSTILWLGLNFCRIQFSIKI